VEDLYWVCDSFSVLPTFMPLKADKELTNLKVGRTLKLKFREILLNTFWLSVKEEQPVSSEMAVRILFVVWTCLSKMYQWKESIIVSVYKKGD
jgi:hypothetical protein